MQTALTSRTDIDVIVSAFLQSGAAAELYGDEADPTRVGRVLWRENLEAARDDLPGRDWSGEEAEIERYAFHEYVGLKLGPATCVIYAYEMETGERQGWRQSEACAILHALYRALACQAPGASKGPWGVRSAEDLARICSGGRAAGAAPPTRIDPLTAVKGSDFLGRLFPTGDPHA